MSMLWRACLAILFACAVAGPAAADGPGSNVRANGVVVVTHLDIIPTFVDQARPVLDEFVADSRNDPGVVVFKMISWTPTTQPLPAHRGVREPEGVRCPRQRGAHDRVPARYPAVHRGALRRAAVRIH